MDALADLERRLDRVERTLAELTQVASTEAPADPHLDLDETFWALRGLTERLRSTAGESTPHPGGPADAEEATISGGVMLVGDVCLPGGGTARWQEGALARDLVDDAWERAADTLQALGHPVRLRLLQEILRGRTTAREMATLDGLGTTGQVYHHLRQLIAAGWVRARTDGTHEIAAERIVPLLVMIVGAQR